VSKIAIQHAAVLKTLFEADHVRAAVQAVVDCETELLIESMRESISAGNFAEAQKYEARVTELENLLSTLDRYRSQYHVSGGPAE